MRLVRIIQLSFALALCLSPACTPTGNFKVSSLPADQTLQEQIVERAPAFVSDRIAVVDISGVLANAQENGLFSEGENPVSFTIEKLNAAAKDGRVKAVVLRVNSPGGTVTASDTLYEEILRFKKATRKPVIAYFEDVAASGAYYLACASDEIIANRTTVTGSIGVVMQMLDLSGTMDKLGISADAITSGAFKDAGSPFRKMKPQERELFQGLVNDFYGRFLDVVAAGRPKLTRDQIKELADGRVYSATQALNSGLVDRIATLPEAIGIAQARAGIKVAIVVRYHRPLSWTPNIYTQNPTPIPQTINLINIQAPLGWTRTPRFMYIWDVGG